MDVAVKVTHELGYQPTSVGRRSATFQPNTRNAKVVTGTADEPVTYSLPEVCGSQSYGPDSLTVSLISESPVNEYTLVEPIFVEIHRDPDPGWIARFVEADISMPGISERDACEALAHEIVEAFEFLTSAQFELGSRPASQLSVLRKYIASQ